MAGMALYISANMTNNSFFMVFDETDAFLDVDNV
jgi:chromosome segregation ATPase